MSKKIALAAAALSSLAGLFPTSAVATDFLTEEERFSARSFKGEGQPFLVLPGCKSVERVFVGGAEVPAYVTHQIPLDADGKQLKDVEYPLWTLAQADTGETILLRARFSNDGIWQEADITVVGEFEEEKKPVKTKAPAPETVEP